MTDERLRERHPHGRACGRGEVARILTAPLPHRLGIPGTVPCSMWACHDFSTRHRAGGCGPW
eukprot:5315777-Prymnesium_polylepis.1